MAKKQTIVKGKKSWHPIIAPKMFNNAVLGETTVYEAEAMKGKRVQQNLMNLTSDVKRQNINVVFEVTSVQDGKGLTDVVAFTMIPSSIRRMVRRRSDRVDLSFATKTADGKVVRIKPMLITRGNTTSVILRKIHKIALDFTLKAVSVLTYDALLADLVSYKLQNELRSKVNKTFPLKSCEIRALELVKEGEQVKLLSVEAPQAPVESEQQEAIAQ